MQIICTSGNGKTFIAADCLHFGFDLLIAMWKWTVFGIVWDLNCNLTDGETSKLLEQKCILE